MLCVAILTAFLLVYLAPFLLRNSALFRIGNDFELFYASYATYQADAAKAGFVGWWNPNEGCGYPLYSNPFAAFLYPGRLFSLALISVTGVYSSYHHQIYMVLGVWILAVGLYVWLRSRGLEPGPCLFAACVVTISYRVADIYRMPNAVHAAAWLPWVLYSFDSWLEDNLAFGLLLGLIAQICLVTAGYPYYFVYGGFLFLSYVALRAYETGRWAGTFSKALQFFVPAILVCAPYLLSVGRLLSQTVDRRNASYTYSTDPVWSAWSYTDLLGGLIFPPSAVSEGWLYIGIAPVILIAVAFSLQMYRTSELGWTLGLALIVQLMAMGDRSFLFPAVWSASPVLSSLRVWSRMTIILLPAVSLLLGRAYADVAQSPPSHTPRLIRVAFLVAGVVAALQALLWSTRTFSPYYIQFFSYMAPSSFVFATVMAALFMAAWLSWRARAPVVWLGLALVVVASDTGQYGRWIWRASVGTVPAAHEELETYYARFFSIPRNNEPFMVVPYRPTCGVVLNWYFERYVTFVKEYGGRPGFAEFTGSNGRKLFLTETLDAPPSGFESWWRASEALTTAAQSTVRPMGRYDGNRLEVAYATARPGYLIWVDNWDTEWTATLNGAPVPLSKAFGTFKAVHVPEGAGSVEFVYRPRFPKPWLSALGVVGVLGIALFPRAKRRGARPRNAEGPTS